MTTQQHYVAGRRLKIGHGFREVGEPVPEAAGWKHLGAYLNSGEIRIVEVPDRFKELEETLSKSTVEELRQIMVELELKATKKKKAEMVAMILTKEIERDLAGERDPEVVPDPRLELDQHNIKELRAMAKDRGITGISKMNKAALVDALLAPDEEE